MGKFYYSVDDDDIGTEHYPVDQWRIACYSSTLASSSAADLAKEAADDYWTNYNDTPSDWPKKITIFTEKGKKLGTFNVDVEAEPVFSVSEVSNG